MAQLRNDFSDITTPRRRLYVFLHGLICLVDAKNLGFKAYVLDAGNSHRYLWGSFLLEKEISPLSQYYPPRAQLVGVETGDKHLNGHCNAIVHLSSLPSDMSKVKAVITLPRPFDIHDCVQGKMQNGCLEGDVSKFNEVPPTVSGLRIFEYELKKDENKIGLVSEDDGSPIWDCPPLAPVPKTDREVASLHVYSEPDHPITSQHNLDEFNMSLEFLGAQAKLVNAAVEPVPNDLMLPGFLPGETETLDARRPAGELILFSARTERPIGGIGAGGGGGSQICGGINGTLI